MLPMGWTRETFRRLAIQLSNQNLMKILAWNVREAAHPDFHSHVIELINQHKPTILVLLETKSVVFRQQRSIIAFLSQI